MNKIDGATVAQAYTTGALPNAADGREQTAGDATVAKRDAAPSPAATGPTSCWPR